MSGELEIRLLGGLQILQNSAPLNHFISNKAPALFAYLAVTKRAHQRDALAALLWGETSDADAKNNLRQALSNLRKFLDPYLLVTRDTIQFNAEAPHMLDVDLFMQGVQPNQQTNKPANQQSPIHSLTQSLNLYHGDFLQGFFIREAPEFEDWAYAERVRLRELAFQALHTLTTYHQTRGEYPQAIQTANRLLTFDPWREETHRDLILLHARNGQRSAALAQYETCRRVLAKELDVEPSVETTALYERIRAAGDSIPQNLPLQPTAFIGRAQELEQIEIQLLKPECRLLTLLGSGGVGKTRLALQTAAQALQQGLFLNGVFFVPLDGVDAPALLPTAIAEACGIPFSGNQDPKMQVLTYLKSREILLVLDNFEHLLDAATWLGEILQSVPDVKILVTSRERLNVRWEWSVPLEGLDYPIISPSHETGQTTRVNAGITGMQFSAVQLFVARAQAVQARFSPDSAELLHIIRICQLVGGTPLALELAAASVRSYTCPEIADEISRNLDFLTTTFRDIPTRQRSLRAVFDSSWQHLTEQARMVFAKLCVFRSGFTREAAQHTAGASLAHLTALVDKSLIRRNAAGRYEIHEALRQYAASRLEALGPETHNATLQHHANHYLALAEKAETEFHGDEQAAWLERLDIEHNNLRAALEWLHESSQFELYARLSGALWLYWYIRSNYREGARWLEPALSHPDKIPLEIRAKTLRGAGVMFTQLADYDLAINYLEQNLAIQRTLGDPISLARALNGLAVTLQARGEYAEALPLYEECLALQRAAGDRIGIAQTLQNLGALALEQDDYTQSVAVSTEAIAIFRAEGIKWGISYTSINLASSLLNLGNPAQARAHILESLQLSREFGSQDSIAEGLEVLANVEERQNQPARAALFLAASDKLRLEVSSPRDTAGVAAYNQLVATLHSQVSETEFKTAWEKGASIYIDELLDLIQKGETDILTPPPGQPFLSPLPAPQFSASPPPVQLADSQNTSYTLENLLARGGMGEVFRGRDSQFGQHVAIKRLLPHLLAKDPAALTRFQREADLLRQLNHPNIVKIITTYTENDQYMIVMEYLPGGSLRDLLDKPPRLPLSQTLKIALELADALARAHHLGIIHRDLKPANILLAEDGSPRLADFGIARLQQQNTRLTEEGAAVGTVAYMSPEACLGEDLDARADVWSFGVLLYEMLTGKNPFERTYYTATLAAVLHSPVPHLGETHPDLPPALANLIQRLLVKDREKRISSMRQIAAELEQMKAEG